MTETTLSLRCDRLKTCIAHRRCAAVLPHVLWMLLVLAGESVAAQPQIKPDELKRFEPTSSAQAPQTFQLRPGLTAQLAAAEPLVCSPVAIAFDEDGRLFVVEMIDYPERREQKLGRIRMLADTDGDGVFDKATVYAKDIAWPTGVYPWNGGVFVVCTPDVLYFKDADGDGVAEIRQVAFTGFGADIQKLNMQGLMNTLTWGLDNRLHGCSGYLYGRITSPARPQNPPMELGRNRGFAFDPRSHAIASENGGGQYGIAFDEAGRLYTCSNARHIQLFAYEDRYAPTNPRFNMPAPLVDIAVDGPACEVFRISPEEPWRVVRTRWRVTGAVQGLIEGGGRASGYITSACGIVIYTGTALGDEFAGDAFVCEPAGNLVTRKKLTPAGSILSAQRAAGEEKMEFFASRDTWCRPVFLANGPDGALWMVDMYRQYIEHPWSLPESLKSLMDLDSGALRGRIWRIAPTGFRPPPPPQLSRATTADLVQLLAHPNGWHRETAARLLYQRQDPSAIKPLREMVRQAPPRGALHALYALDGLSQLHEADVIAALQRSRDGDLQLNALKLADRFAPAGKPSAALWAAITQCAASPLPVKHQLALTLSHIQHHEKIQLIARLARSESADVWIRGAVLAAAGEESGALFSLLVEDLGWLANPQSRELARPLLRQVGAARLRDPADLAAQRIAALEDDQTAIELAAALWAGLQQGGGRRIVGEPAESLVRRARVALADRKAAVTLRIAAIELLGLQPFEQASAQVLSVLGPAEPHSLQLAAIAALDRWPQENVASPLLDRWPGLSQPVRQAALSLLIKRPTRAKALLDAIKTGKVSRADVSTSHLAALRQNNDKSVRELTSRIFATPGARRQDVVNSFLPAMDLQGDAARGHKAFADKCAQCHRLQNQGHALGPDLETVRDWTPEKVLVAILDPNRDILPAYMAYIVETIDNEQHIGLLTADTPAAITLRMASSKEVTLKRDEIQSMRTANLSVMPEGQEEGMKLQDMADLMKFVLPGK